MAADIAGAEKRQGTVGNQWPLVGRAREVFLLKESIRDRHGAVITGEAGVGKTALAMAGVGFAREQGMAVAVVAGTEAARSFPFGAFALFANGPVPESAGPESPAELLHHCAHELVDQAGGRPLLVFVDDAHLLDDGSAMLVHQLSQSGTATIVACLRADTRNRRPASDVMMTLWKDLSARRIELRPLDQQAIDEVLRAVLGGSVDISTTRQFAERTLGDPLFLRELIEAALETDVLRDEGGVWRLRGPLTYRPRLADLVCLRLGPLSDEERHVVELLAIGEPLTQTALDQLADAAAVESLEDRGVIASRMDGRRLHVYLAHPVFGQVVRLCTSARRERVLAQALLEASGGRRQEDALVLASLRLVGGGGDSDLLLAGARAAHERRDFELTERMARAAIESGEGFEARLLAVEAAYALGRRAQAEDELATLAVSATTDSEKVRVALLSFDQAFFSHGSADTTAIDQLLCTIAEPPWRDELLARRLLLEGHQRGPRAVIAAAPALGPDSTTPRTGLQAVVGDALARAGRLHEALELLTPLATEPSPHARAVRRGEDVEAWSPFGTQGLALIGLGRLSEVEQLLASAHEDLPLNSGSLESAVVAANLAALRLEQGRVQSSFLQASSAAAIFMDRGLPVSARWCYAHCALALALAGVEGKASETLAELDALGLPTDMEYEAEVLTARAWTWAAAGDLGTPRKNLEVAVELAIEVGDLLGATKALHGLARLGRARHVVDQLGALAMQVDGELTQARLAYTKAAAAKEGHALDVAARRFEEIGTLLYAAEALGEAAVQFRRQGQNREAAAAQQKAARLLSRCEGAVTPFVRAIGARAQLTPAELDTALQAATGSTDKQIAELMHLSVRTVENRLHRAYQKLGLSHRRELAEALRDLPGT